MNIDIQYLNDSKGQTRAVQLPLSDWEKVLNKIKKYEEALKLKSDLSEAFKQVSLMRKQKSSAKQNLKSFLDEL